MTVNRICIVGGVNRDRFLNEMHGTNFPLHDVDLSIEADTFEEMCDWATSQGGTIRTMDVDHGTIKFTVPKGNWIHNLGSNAIDAVWCRIDGPVMDGRHPLWVKPATTEADLARRDFPVNAIAVQILELTDGIVTKSRIIDPHNGIRDCEFKILQFVGDPMERISEDGLRLVRAWRFWATRDLLPTNTTWAVMNSQEAANMVGPGTRTSAEKMFDEMEAMCRATTTLKALHVFSKMPVFLRERIFPEDGQLHMIPTMTKKKG